MAPRSHYRLNPPIIDADRAAFAALQDMHDYTPVNQAFSAERLGELEAALMAAEQAEARALRAADLARDQVIAAAWAFHEAILGAKAQVIAQYGDDSPAVAAMGLKRRSQRRRPTRRPASPAQ